MGIWNIVKKDVAFHRRKFFDEESDFRFKYFISSLLDPSCKMVIWYRIYSVLYYKGGFYKYLAYFFYVRVKKKYAYDIHPQAVIGVPFKLGHGFGVVIGSKVKVGDGCYFFNDVTLGNKNVGVENEMPVVGSGVIIGTGAKILGGVSIGSESIIGANSVLFDDVGGNEVWAGAPARFIKDSN